MCCHRPEQQSRQCKFHACQPSSMQYLQQSVPGCCVCSYSHAMHSVQLHCALLAIARLQQQGLVVDVDRMTLMYKQAHACNDIAWPSTCHLAILTKQGSSNQHPHYTHEQRTRPRRHHLVVLHQPEAAHGLHTGQQHHRLHKSNRRAGAAHAAVFEGGRKQGASFRGHTYRNCTRAHHMQCAGTSATLQHKIQGNKLV